MKTKTGPIALLASLLVFGVSIGFSGAVLASAQTADEEEEEGIVTEYEDDDNEEIVINDEDDEEDEEIVTNDDDEDTDNDSSANELSCAEQYRKFILGGSQTKEKKAELLRGFDCVIEQIETFKDDEDAREASNELCEPVNEIALNTIAAMRKTLPKTTGCFESTKSLLQN